MSAQLGFFVRRDPALETPREIHVTLTLSSAQSAERCNFAIPHQALRQEVDIVFVGLKPAPSYLQSSPSCSRKAHRTHSGTRTKCTSAKQSCHNNDPLELESFHLLPEKGSQCAYHQYVETRDDLFH